MITTSILARGACQKNTSNTCNLIDTGKSKMSGLYILERGKDIQQYLTQFGIYCVAF